MLTLKAWLPAGSALMISQLDSAQAATENMATGRESRSRLNPPVLNAVSSLSAESRPKVTTVARKTDIGTVSTRIEGSRYSTRRRIDADVDTLVDDQFHEPQDLAHEQQEGEDEHAEEKRGNEFPQQVAIDELHPAGLYGLGDHRAMHAAALADGCKAAERAAAQEGPGARRASPGNEACRDAAATGRSPTPQMGLFSGLLAARAEVGEVGERRRVEELVDRRSEFLPEHVRDALVGPRARLLAGR